jgi:hypothetical protein
MTETMPLTVVEIRHLARKHARLLAILLDTLPCSYELEYDDAVAVAARLLVDHAPIFCEIVSLGTGMTDAQVQLSPWPEVVNLGCRIIEATREVWRPAWPNGFLQAILSDELRPYSSFVRGASRS